MKQLSFYFERGNRKKQLSGLTKQDIIDIYKNVGGFSGPEIARQYGCKSWLIYNIWYGYSGNEYTNHLPRIGRKHLTEKQRREIQRSKEKVADIAKQYHISTQHVYRLKKRKSQDIIIDHTIEEGLT